MNSHINIAIEYMRTVVAELEFDRVNTERIDVATLCERV